MSNQQSPKHWKTVASKQLFTHPRLSIFEDAVILPNGHQTNYLRFGSGDQSVTIICIRNDKILLQQEYSHPVGSVLYQFPGGKIENGEDIISAAKRELAEESMLEANNLISLGWYYPNNRRSDAKMHVLLATDTHKSEQILTGDIEEDIDSQWMDISHFENLIRTNQIINFSVLSAWTLYKAQ